jgi:hypothetical protein
VVTFSDDQITNDSEFSNIEMQFWPASAFDQT